MRGRSWLARECIHERSDRIARPPRRRGVAAGFDHVRRLGLCGVPRGTPDCTVEKGNFSTVEAALVE